MIHAVVLDEPRCLGCTSCVKCCPTEAIRVRNGKATILPDRCIDCGKCIRVCPHKAIRSVGDDLSLMDRFRWKVALPEPALYGQFQNLNDINIILNGLLKLGFDQVYEVGRAAEMLSARPAQLSDDADTQDMPILSSTCPTVLRLIRMRFPRLIGQIDRSVLPMELAARLARQEAAEATGLPPEEIGVFAIVPCSSKVTAAHNPEGLSQPVLDGAFAIRDIYLRLLGPMRSLTEVAPLSAVGKSGSITAASGGPSALHDPLHTMAVTGISDVIRVLEAVEDERLSDVEFLELSACGLGCLGGCFNVEDPYAAQMRLRGLAASLPPQCNQLPDGADAVHAARFDRELDYIPSFLLDADRGAAMEKEFQIRDLERHLPGLHCGSCGAPTCRAFAEDVVLGRANQDDCIFKVRARMLKMAGVSEAEEYLPAPFRRAEAAPGGPAHPEEDLVVAP